MALAPTDGQMAKNMLASGKMASRMEKEFMYQ